MKPNHDTIPVPKLSITGMAQEYASILNIARLAYLRSVFKQCPKGHGQPILVIPGLTGNDATTLPLRWFLKKLNYDVRGWELGLNYGVISQFLPNVILQAKRFYQERGEPIILIGWSLGGVLARETARLCPDLVSHVVTLGAPVVGGPKYTVVNPFYRWQGYDLETIEQSIEQRNLLPIEVPITAFYSKRDKVVAWEACIDHTSNNVEHIEVNSLHIGMAYDPEVFKVLARKLAEY